VRPSLTSVLTEHAEYEIKGRRPDIKSTEPAVVFIRGDEDFTEKDDRRMKMAKSVSMYGVKSKAESYMETSEGIKNRVITLKKKVKELKKKSIALHELSDVKAEAAKRLEEISEETTKRRDKRTPPPIIKKIRPIKKKVLWGDISDSDPTDDEEEEDIRGAAPDGLEELIKNAVSDAVKARLEAKNASAEAEETDQILKTMIARSKKAEKELEGLDEPDYEEEEEEEEEDEEVLRMLKREKKHKAHIDEKDRVDQEYVEFKSVGDLRLFMRETYEQLFTNLRDIEERGEVARAQTRIINKIKQRINMYQTYVSMEDCKKFDYSDSDIDNCILQSLIYLTVSVADWLEVESVGDKELLTVLSILLPESLHNKIEENPSGGELKKFVSEVRKYGVSARHANIGILTHTIKNIKDLDPTDPEFEKFNNRIRYFSNTLF